MKTRPTQKFWPLQKQILPPLELRSSCGINMCVKKLCLTNQKSHRQGMVWNGMEWKMEWNGTEISVWNMEDARMEWNGRFQEWNGRQSSILPYQFHT